MNQSTKLIAATEGLKSDADGFVQAMALSVPQAAINDLKILYTMLTERNSVMNLVGPATLSDFWNRHVLDSAQLLDLVPQARQWADIGAGAGFPGLVLAILLKHADQSQDHHVTLIESLHKRCRFLQEVSDKIGLKTSVINERAEKVAIAVDCVTARAVAPLPKLLGFAFPMLQKGAIGLFLKGQNLEDELIQAKKTYDFESHIYSSKSDPRGRIIEIRSLRRAKP